MKFWTGILFLLLLGCKESGKSLISNSENDVETTVFDFTKIGIAADSIRHQELLPLSLLADSIQVVKLETGNNCLVDGKADYFIGDTFILVSQRDQVMLFDRTGRFLRTVARKGRGPGEYESFEDISVDEARGMVYLLGEFGDVKMYNLSDSNYFKRFECAGSDRFYNSILSQDSGRLLVAPCLYKDTKHLIVQLDTTGQFVCGLPCSPNDKKLTHIEGKKLIYRVGDEYHYVSSNDDTVYRVTGNTLKLKWVFNVKGAQRVEMNGETRSFLFPTVLTIEEQKEKEGRTLTTYSNTFYCYDKRSRQLLTYDKVWDDYLLTLYWKIDNLHIQDGDRFYWVYPAPLLEEFIPQVLELEEVKPGMKERLTDLQKTLSTDDNPVLLIGRLK